MTLRNLKEGDPLRGNIEEIMKAGLRSAALTDQLLAFSRRQVLRPVVLNLNTVIADTLKMLQRLIGEDIQLTATLEPRIGRVIVDPGQFSQIVMNLAVNARDAMPQGGTLTIATANVFIEPEYARQHVGIIPGAYVLTTVSDNGSGISEDIKQHIFEPFFTTKEVGRGTGLGLATAYGIVKQSGGSIEVSSEEGTGTTFRVFLPRVTAAIEVSNKKQVPLAMSGGTETILLVEDEDLVRNLSRQILEECGYKVIEAINGIEALQICARQGPIDLLLTDVVMPQMGGRELSEKLRETIPDVRILFTSGYTDDEVVKHGVIEIDTNFIQKPFTPESLAQKVREVLDNGKKKTG
jgi:CheY-like chemotaxis protein